MIEKNVLVTGGASGIGAATVRAEEYAPAGPDDIPDGALAAALATHRSELGQLPMPVIAVISNSLDLDPGASLFTDAQPPTIVLTTEQSPVVQRDALSAVADVVVVGSHTVDPGEALAMLADRGFERVQCEGGPHVLGQFIATGVVDELCLTTTPLVLGGDAPRIVVGLPVARPTMTLAQVLEGDGSLFTRWLRPGAQDPSTSARS
jgi:riboflavin biosynthesis pyrimidine reductase